MMKQLCIVIVLFCLGCCSRPPVLIHIALINNHQAVKITGLDIAVIRDIARDTTNHFESLFAVYRMPADTDMKDYQPLQPGRYEVKNSAVIFTPDTPFVKKQGYFIRYYQYGEGNSALDFVKGKKTASKLRFTDLIFKP
jgi:hypothetical protein